MDERALCICFIILFVRVARAAVVLFHRRWSLINKVGLFTSPQNSPTVDNVFIVLFGLIGIGYDYFERVY